MKQSDKYNHLQAKSALHSSLDGSIDEVQLKKLEQHLEICAECRAYAEGLKGFEVQLKQSLQSRWPEIKLKETELASVRSEVLTQGIKNQMKVDFSATVKSIGWVALVILFVSGLVWTIGTLAPIPSRVPAGLSTPDSTAPVLLPSESPLPTLQDTSQEPLPTPTTNVPPSGSVSLFPNLLFSFTAEIPTSSESMIVYRQQLSQAVTAELARQVADQWGIAGWVYSSPSEGRGDVVFDVMDGSRSIRFLNFPDQFIYQLGYASPDYGSALMDNGPLPPFDEQVAIASDFLKPFGILDLPYQTMPLETERGVVAFIPLLDGHPVIQEIGVDRSNIGWIDVKVNPAGQVTMVQYSHHDFQPVGEYPILTAQQAWDRFSKDTNLQHSRYAVLSAEQPTTYQAWARSYLPGQQADIYGWVNAYQPSDPNSPELVMINNLPIMGDTASMSPDNRYDVRFVHAWGQIIANSPDGIGLSLAGWEVSSLTDEYITGTISTQADQTQIVALDRTLTLIDPPSNIPDGTQVGIQGVVLDGNPPVLNWKFIETGIIPLTYGASNSCGGGGGGGMGSVNADFGAGTFALPNLEKQSPPVSTPIIEPYQPGDEINAATGTVYVTKQLYLGGKTATDVNFTPDSSSSLDSGWGYSLVGENLSGFDKYHNLPVRIWGRVERLENGVVYITVDRYEPLYPGEQIQAWAGTEQLVTIDEQSVVLFTTSGGESYVLKSSVDYPPADANIIGRLGDLIEIEGYIIPDKQIGGYLLIKDTAGSTQPDGIADSSLVYVWDHSQDPSSNPGAVLHGQITIDKVELAYDAINLDRCQATAAQDPNLSSWLVVQPTWVYTGHFDDGRRFIVQVQALPDEYLQ